jgi:hypothetical protein
VKTFAWPAVSFETRLFSSSATQQPTVPGSFAVQQAGSLAASQCNSSTVQRFSSTAIQQVVDQLLQPDFACLQQALHPTSA